MSLPSLELIGRSSKEQTSIDEERQLQDWRMADPENDAYYRRIVRFLATVAAVADNANALRAPTAARLIRIAERDNPGNQRSRTYRGGPRWLHILAATAAVLALVFGGLYYESNSRIPAFRMGNGEYVSGPNETTTATLADGTVVRLGPNSRLRILDNAGRRDVFLSGRAFLAVTHMPDVPFRVQTSLGEILVLGTRFDVLASDELRVVVVEGNVSLSNGRDEVRIPSGQMSLVTDGTLMQPVKVDVQSLVAWVSPFIVFQETPLRDVVKELEHEYDARVILKDSSMADLTVTGWYFDRSFEEVIVIVCGVLGAECSVRNRTATIDR